MNPSLSKRKHLPRSTKGLSNEELIEILRKKKECKVKALKIVEALCEEDVNPDFLLANLRHIDKSHYEDVVTERSILKICGYPLCNKPLGEVPKQQYRISLVAKNVYDITERKMFCGGLCFKASNYLKNQLLTSPLWFRDGDQIVKFHLLPPKEEPSPSESSIVDDVDTSARINQDIALGDLTDPITAEKEQLKNRAKTETKITKNKARVSVSNIEVVPIDPIRKIEKSVEEWFSISTYVYLFGEEKLKTSFTGQEDLLKSLKCHTSTYLNSKRIEDISKIFSILKLDGDDDKEEVNLKPLPDYSFLKEEAKSLNIKVRAFYAGQLETSRNEDTSSGEGRHLTGDIPLVDSQSQTALRRRVLLDQLNRFVPDVCVTLGVEGFFGYNDIRALAHTFLLSAHNITFKPREWFLLGAVIIKLFSLKINPLAISLRQEETQKRITLLLMSYNLSCDYLDNISEWLIDCERITRSLQLS